MRHPWSQEKTAEHWESISDGSMSSAYLDAMELIYFRVSDTEDTAKKLADKLVKLRIFSDEDGKTNLSLGDVDGEVLVISQFTLYADCKKNRPSFCHAGKPELANRLYEYFMERCKTHVEKVEHGIFGADMKISLVNDGPFTLMLDSTDLFTK